MKIELKKIGKILSGRSEARKLAEKLDLQLGGNIVLDFESIDSVTQSFISELLVVILKAGGNLEMIKGENFNRPAIERRFDDEKQRLDQIQII